MILEIAIVIFIIGLVYLAIIFLGKLEPTVPRTSLNPQNLKTLSAETPVVVVFGASGNVGLNIVKEFVRRKCIVIGLSRKYNNWYAKTQDDESLAHNVHWLGCDVRLHREVKCAFQKIKELYGRIDIVINAAIIGRPGTIPSFNTGVDGDSIFVRLPNARMTKKKMGVSEAQDSFFTNFVGLCNLLREEIYEVKDAIVLPKNVDPFTDLLIDQYHQTDIAKHINLVKLNLKKPEKVADLVLKKYDTTIEKL